MQNLSMNQLMVTAVEHAEERLPIMPHLPELVWGLLMFGVIFLVVRKVAWPRLEGTVEKRQDAIEGGMRRAEEAEAKALAAKRTYEEQLRGAHDEAARIREEAKEQGAQIKADLRTEAQQEANRITEAAHKQIEAERQQAMVQLRGEVGRLSTDLAGRIVGESLQEPARQSGIVDRFIADLEAGDKRAVTAGQES